MKKQLIVATVLSLYFVSCSKSNNSQPLPVAKGYLRGKVDGVFFNDATSAYVHTEMSPTPIGTFIIGQYGNGGITLSLPPFPTAGVRLLNQANTDAITINTYSAVSFYAGFGGNSGIPQGSGEINILEITNGYIRGTFECIAPVDSTRGIILPPIHITEGEFNLKF